LLNVIAAVTERGAGCAKFDLPAKREAPRIEIVQPAAIAQLRYRGSVEAVPLGELQHQLAALGADVAGRGGRGRPSSLKGQKVAPKYRNPKNRSETWAGRGVMPRWMAAEIKAGKKREDFLIQKPAARARKKK
jgi:H-NS histone family